MNKAKSKPNLDRYSAMLLFQFRVVIGGDSGKRRICEKRLIVFRALNPRKALQEAKRRGRKAQHSYVNSDGNKVHIEFVGVIDLLHLGIECEADEVWYQICQMVEPMERRKRCLPTDSQLLAK